MSWIRSLLLFLILGATLFAQEAAETETPAVEESTAVPAEAVESTAATPDEAVSPGEEAADLDAQIAALAAELEGASLEDAEKGRLGDVLAQAKADREAASRARAELEKLKADIASFDNRLSEYSERIKSVPEGSAEFISSADGAGLQRLEEMEVELKAQLDQARQRFADAEKTADTALNIPNLDGKAVADLAKRIEDLKASARVSEDDGLLPTRIAALASAIKLEPLEAELALRRHRLANYERLSQLALAERDLAKAILEVRNSRIATVRERVQEARKLKSQLTRIQTEQVADSAKALPEPLREFSEANAELARELESITEEESAVVAQLNSIEETTEDLDEEFAALSRRVEVAGDTVAIGRLLLARRGQIIARAEMVSRDGSTSRRIAAATNRQIDLAEGLIPSEVPVGERAHPAAAQLEAARKELLLKLEQGYGRLVGALTNLSLAEESFVQSEKKLGTSVETWLMWSRTDGVLRIQDLPKLVVAVSGDYVRIARSVLGNTSEAVRGNIPLTASILLGSIGLLLVRPRCQRRFEAILKDTRRVRSDRHRYSCEALLLSAVRVAALPFLLGAIGWMIDGNLGLDGGSGPGAALKSTARWFFILWFLADIGLPFGFGGGHLRWSPEWCAHYRKELRWFVPVVGILAVFGVRGGMGNPDVVTSEIRSFYVVWLLVFGIFGFRLLREKTKWNLAAPNKPSNFFRNRRALLIVQAILTAFFAWMLLLGYGYTVGVLLEEIATSILVIIGILLVEGLIQRSLSLSERRLRFQQAVERLEEAKRKQQESGTGEGAKTLEGLTPEEPEIDLSRISEKAVRLVRAIVFIVILASLWAIWTRSIPLVESLSNVQLPLSRNMVIEGITQSVPLTIADLLVVVVIGALTVIAASNGPGLLEILLLPYLGLDKGARYAVITLTQYLIIALGIYFFFRELGFEWSSVQWLVAALGVGLGFGLQEIVANFVSGIILLFERPVRVGDIVTVGDTTGIVSKIRIRAVTVMNWDKQELLIPNKEFITGKLLNWTLSDTLNRIVIPIGVAYGTNTTRALEVVSEIVANDEEVLKEPKPLLTFEGFGDSSLNLLLRCYLPTLDNRLSTITRLHTRIHERFMEEGIEIAFPQMDLHLRDVPRGLVREQ